MKTNLKHTAAAGISAALLGACATAPEPEPVVEAPPPAPPPVVVVEAPPPPPPAPPPPPVNPYGTILAGVLDLPRVSETAAIDGCQKVHRGLTMGGGFLFFTCEKLRPGIGIDRQEAVADTYGDALSMKGWERRYNEKKKQNEWVAFDSFGCKMTVSIKPWTDRSMNEPRGKRREDFRQIVFMTHFAKGQACEPAYQEFRRTTFS